MNVFGERQHPEKFIPKCIISARDGLTVDIHSNSKKTKAGSRHYIHASDVADGCLFLIKNKFCEKCTKNILSSNISDFSLSEL